MLFNRALLAALAGYATAQTFTDCDPTKKDCPSDTALGTDHTWSFNTSLNEKVWTMKTGTYEYNDEGALFTLSKEGESTLLQSNFYIFFGRVEAHVKMAPGRGLVSSVVLESDDLDEIDWEWVGYNTSEVQTNFYGKGNDTWDDERIRGRKHPIANADLEFHNYTTYWDQDKLQWWVNGDMIRQLDYADPLTLGGKEYPQTPSRVKFSLWPAGSKQAAHGTVEWAGGLVNWDDAPFTMTLGQLRVEDFHTGKEYSYGDRSGSWQSIEITPGNSTVLDELNKPPAKSLSEKWDDLGQGAHIGVYIGAAVFAAICIAGFVFFCLRQRRKGRLEKALDGDQNLDHRNEMNNFQNDWRQSEWKHGGYQQVNN